MRRLTQLFRHLAGREPVTSSDETALVLARQRKANERAARHRSLRSDDPGIDPRYGVGPMA